MANAVRAQNEHTQGNLKPFVDIRSISHASSSCAEHDQMKIKKLTITAQCPTIRWKSTPLEPLSRDQENVSMSLCVDGYTNHDICMLQTFPIHNQTNALINVNPSLSNIFKYNSFEQYRIKWFQMKWYRNEISTRKFHRRDSERQRCRESLSLAFTCVVCTATTDENASERTFRSLVYEAERKKRQKVS